MKPVTDRLAKAETRPADMHKAALRVVAHEAAKALPWLLVLATYWARAAWLYRCGIYDVVGSRLAWSLYGGNCPDAGLPRTRTLADAC
jgi:hypothetical protein